MRTGLGRVRKVLRGYEPTWRYLFNLSPTLRYRKERIKLEGEAAQVVETLSRDGIAITSVNALFRDPTVFEDLRMEFLRLQRERADEIQEARARAQDNDSIGEKTFIFMYLDAKPDLDPESVCARFALQPEILEIANAYFGMYTRLRYYNFWHTFATSGPARESQLWHRDREDLLILKVFLYLEDVDEGAGPFTYARGSHHKGAYHREPSYSLEGGVRRSEDDQMAEVVPPDRWLRATGPAGTIVFADTHGYHKGGLARKRDRLMYVTMFTSQTSGSAEMLRWERQIALPDDSARAFALTPRNGSKYRS